MQVRRNEASKTLPICLVVRQLINYRVINRRKISGKFNNNAKIINKNIKQERPQDKSLKLSGKNYKGRCNNSRNTYTS
jgi:hypothetical protein